MAHVQRSVALIALALLALPAASCRKRAVRAEQAANLPPIEVTGLDVDVRESDCAHGVVEAGKELKSAIETEFGNHGYKVGSGGMKAQGSATIAKCKGALGMATVSLFVFSPEGKQLARTSKRYRLNTKNDKATAESLRKAAKQIVAAVQKSRPLRQYAARAEPGVETAVAANDPPPPPPAEEKAVELGDEDRKVDVPPPTDGKPAEPVERPAPPPEDEAAPVVMGKPLNTDWIVAVMDVKDLNAGDRDRAIDEDVIRNLGSQLRIYIAQRGAKTVDRSTQEAALKDQVQAMKNESYKSCYDDSCQIELGKALAASHLLRSQITRFGSRCVLNAELFDLAKEVTIAASSSRGDCEPEGFLRMSEEVANTLTVQ
jgi:hypothetical protein